MRTRPLIIAAVALLTSAALASVLWLADLGESAGLETGTTLRDVTGDPRRYEGRTVTVSGEYAENDYFTPQDAEYMLVIGDDAGRRLLVLPQPQAGVPLGVDENSVLRVTGEVRVVEPSAADGGDEGPLSQGGLLAQTGAEAVIEAIDVSYAGTEPSPTQPTVSRATVGQVVEDPRAFSDSIVRIAGRAYVLGDRGFVLAGDRSAIFVGAPASELGSIGAGERVLVDAEVARISRFRTRVIEAALSQKKSDADGVDLNLVPNRPGEPYLVLRGMDRSP